MRNKVKKNKEISYFLIQKYLRLYRSKKKNFVFCGIKKKKSTVSHSILHVRKKRTLFYFDQIFDFNNMQTSF